MVGSTELAAQLGDRRWKRTLAAHHAAIRRELRRHHGREVDTAGDGFFAIFENPTDAVRCAAAAVASAHALGLRIRAGVHTGEVEPMGATFGGIAVHIGARLLAAAGPNQVYVSSTVRDLVAGSGHEFEDRGAHELKGVPGQWHLYSLALPAFEEGVPLIGVDDDELRAIAARRQRLVTGGLVLVIVLLFVGIAGAYLVLTRAASPQTGADSVVAYDAAASAPVLGWHVGRGPEALVLADGVLWVANIDSGTVSRVDTTSGTTASYGQVGSRPSALAVAGGRVWVADRYSSQIAALDIRQGSLLDRLDVHASAILAEEGQLWLADDLTDRLVRLNPENGAEIAAFALPSPAGPSGLAISGGSIWVAAPRADTVLRFHAGTGAPLEPLVEISAIRTMAALGDDLWVASPSTDRIARVDTATGRVAVRVDVCDTPIALAPTPTAIWVACATDRTLWRVDRAGQVQSQVELGAVPTALVAQGERVWVTLRAD
jgi:streptogramin lyase